MRAQSTTATLARWIAFAPAAAIAGYLAWIAAKAISHIGFLLNGQDSEYFINKLSWISLAHIAMGAAFVYVGAMIAPTTKKRAVAFGMSAVALMVAGVGIFASFIAQDYWAVYAAILIAASASLTAWLGVQDEQEVLPLW